MSSETFGFEKNLRRISQDNDARPLLDKMRTISSVELKRALDEAQEAKRADPAAGIFIAKFDTPPIGVGGQQYFFYGARVLGRTGEGNQPFVTPHYHLVGDEPYYFGTGTGEMNFGKVADEGVEWEAPVVVRRGDEFLIAAGQVHSFRNVGGEPVDFIFSCPESHLQDRDDTHPDGDRYIVRDLPGGTPKHFE